MGFMSKGRKKGKDDKGKDGNGGIGLADVMETIQRVLTEVLILRGEVAKLVYDSMVREHARSIAALGEMVGRQFQRVHVVSGGSRNRYFCQNLADALAVPVVAGPAEATAIGNILLQAWVMGTIPSPDTITQISVDSFPRGRFRPR